RLINVPVGQGLRQPPRGAEEQLVRRGDRDHRARLVRVIALDEGPDLEAPAGPLLSADRRRPVAAGGRRTRGRASRGAEAVRIVMIVEGQPKLFEVVGTLNA